MRPEVIAGMTVGFLSAIWNLTAGGTVWESIGLFLILGALIEWLGSIFLKRSHALTQEDIYKQLKVLQEKIRGFDDDER